MDPGDEGGEGDGGNAEDDDAFCGADAGGVCAEDPVFVDWLDEGIVLVLEGTHASR